jgi:hypothetical protein
MIFAGGRLLLVTSLALAVAACQTEDKGPQPRFVSDARDSGIAAVPSATAMAAESSQERGHFIEFRSRYALSYGHTYVIFGRAGENGQMINPEVAGLAPASTSEVPYVLGHFVPVPAETGWSDGDLEEEYRSASWRVMLTEAEYKEVVANIRKLQASSPVWNATFYNCNAFVGDIARSMGYKVPSKWLRSQQFVTRLREMNTGQ